MPSKDLFKVICRQTGLHPVVDFSPLNEKLKHIDLSESNMTINPEVVSDTASFAAFIDEQRSNTGAKYLIGGYKEHRNVYARSALFDAPTDPFQIMNTEEPRRLHLGVDVWGKVGTSVYSPLPGSIHSFAFNAGYGNYGATVIVKHKVEEITFYILYGHLSLADIQNLKEGQYITKGQVIGHFGGEEENGHWPPHLHFQLIMDIGYFEGDYPGVCRYSERKKYLNNSPDPDVILMLQQYAEM